MLWRRESFYCTSRPLDEFFVRFYSAEEALLIVSGRESRHDALEGGS